MVWQVKNINLPEAYDHLEIPKVIYLETKDINDKKEEWINEWLSAS